MPTPIPSNQIIAEVKQSVDLAVQQGVVGVLLIFAFAIAVVAVVGLIYVIRRPAKVTGERDVAIAISSLADKAETRSTLAEARAEKKDELLQKQSEQHSAEMKEWGDKFLGAMDQMAKANLSLAGNQTIQTGGISSIQDTVKKIAEEGSLPLRGLVETAARIEMAMDQIVRTLIPANKDMHRKEIADFQDALNSLREYVMVIATNMQNRVDEKRQTGSLKPVVNNGSQDSIDGVKPE